jgi:hypothetical protein
MVIATLKRPAKSPPGKSNEEIVEVAEVEEEMNPISATPEVTTNE